MRVRVVPVPAVLAVAALGLVAAGEAGKETQGERLRGVGILILDPRDTPEAVKERFRLFLEQVRPNVPEKYRQEGNQRALEALLAADLEPGREPPELRLAFHEEVTPEMVLGFIRATPAAQESMRVCPPGCALREHAPIGMHLHLTRSSGGPGDSIIVLRFQSGGMAGAVEAAQADLENMVRMRFLEDYRALGYERKPVARVFGVGVVVVVGEPKVGEEYLPPDPGGP